MDPQLTIVIPTRNRWPYLDRMLRYYAEVGVGYPLIIGDSSDPEHYAAAEAVLAAVSGKLRIEYFAAPGLSASLCQPELLKRVNTPYVVLVADDDLLVARGIRDAVDFLERNLDYNVVHGQAVMFATNADQPCAEIKWVSDYPQRSVDGDTASERIVNHFARYCPTIYSVHRTSLQRRAYQMVADLELDGNFSELLQSCLPIIHGKTKKLNVLYLARQAHSSQSSRGQSGGLDWLGDDRWPIWYRKFCDSMAAEISGVDDIEPNQARNVVKQAFCQYLVTGLSRTLKKPLHKRYRSSLASLGERFPGLYRSWQTACLAIAGHPYTLSLPGLMRQSSPYHSDFMPLYRSITSLS